MMINSLARLSKYPDGQCGKEKIVLEEQRELRVRDASKGLNILSRFWTATSKKKTIGTKVAMC